jgi:energy-coupling factor transport system ATP-binding protein
LESIAPTEASAATAPALAFHDVSFSYAAQDGEVARPILSHLSLDVEEGSLTLLTGPTGCGKTTLLSLAKPEVAPAGTCTGGVCVMGHDVRRLSPVESARLVGYVFQDPDAQVVCDTVWHEMAFGLENLGVPEPEMHRRVAETCTFLGMEPWFRQSVATLSGGQRQVLALAATLAMQPRLLLLDEPTSMLDPVAERDFLHALFRVNHELGTTVVVATHRPAPMVGYATAALRMEDGQVSPVTSLDGLSTEPDLLSGTRWEGAPAATSDERDAAAAGMDGVWMRYQRDEGWVLRDCSLAVASGSVHAIIGGNGSGKTSLLLTLAGVTRVSRGRVTNPLAVSQALLPQDPKVLLVGETVADVVDPMHGHDGHGPDEGRQMLERMGLSGLEDRSPFDLSAGQQQLLALARLLLHRPRLLLLDEPTKGLDDAAASLVAQVICERRDAGCTIVLATHDLRLARQVSDTTSLLFDGGITATLATDDYFRRTILNG